MCPNCGYCPHCGRVARPPYWSYPPYPQGPIYVTPQWLTTTIQPGTLTTGGHFVPTNTTNDLGPNISFTQNHSGAC